MQGSFKTPGGKLVVVDFTLEGDRIRNPRIHGDFFLYPDEALEPITAALDGLSAGMPEHEMVRQIEEAIPEGTEWLGSSADAVVIAVRRALAEASEEELR
jgi:lipoate---protein ligase